MREKEAMKYIRKMGLEKCHNAIKRAGENGEVYMKTEMEIFMTAQALVKNCVVKYGKGYRVSLYILREDGTAQLFYNDAKGVNGSSKQPFEKVKDYADRFASNEDYILMIETKPNRFSIVTQK